MSATKWGERAATLYDVEYARKYRAVDDEIRDGALVQKFGGWLRELCESFGRDITVLDLGCGTGRYFWALRHTNELVGIDVSAPMLAEARRPVDAGHVQIRRIELIHDDFLTHEFDEKHFDLVYSIGVLGEHTPFNAEIASRVRRWLVPGGLFAFTGVHVQSSSIPRSLKRRVGERLIGIAPAGLKTSLRERVLAGGLYVDRPYLKDVLTAAHFAVESIEYHQSDVHLHCLCVARRPRG